MITKPKSMLNKFLEDKGLLHVGIEFSHFRDGTFYFEGWSKDCH